MMEQQYNEDYHSVNFSTTILLIPTNNQSTNQSHQEDIPMTEQQPQPTLLSQDEHIALLEARIARLESVVFPQFSQQSGNGQKRIYGDGRRTEAGMGAILNTGSEFI